MRAWHNILPPLQAENSHFGPKPGGVPCRKYQDIYKKTTKYFNFNLPRAIQVYKIPTKHPVEHYKNKRTQKKQAAHQSHEDRRWQIQPGTRWEHSKISMVPTSGRGQVLKWQKMRFSDGFNWKAALLLWETQQQPPGFLLPNSCFDCFLEKGRDRI